MSFRIIIKKLKKRGYSLKALVSLYEEVQKGIYIRKDTFGTQNENPSMTAYIYKSEFDYISRCILDYKNIETGGQLFGFWTADGSPVVVYAIGPGRNANHQVAFFNQDMEYLVTVGKVLVHHYGLQHIGEWHSHHQLGLAQPSGHDASTMADTIREKRLSRFLLCIGNCSETESTLNPFNFTLSTGYSYVKAHWTIRNIDSPYRDTIDSELRNLLIQPTTKTPCYKLNDSVNCTNKGHWFESKSNRMTLKSIVDFLSSYPEQGQCSIQMDAENQIHITVKRNRREEYIFFPSKFPQEAPKISIHNDCGISSSFSYKWKYDGDIYDSFTKYYKSIKYDG